MTSLWVWSIRVAISISHYAIDHCVKTFQEDTISINHNWINGSGVLRSWQHLTDELQLVCYDNKNVNIQSNLEYM